jgi:hypothetical protein
LTTLTNFRKVRKNRFTSFPENQQPLNDLLNPFGSSATIILLLWSERKRLKMKTGVIALLFIFLLSCKKDGSCGPCYTEAGFVSATIIDGGPIETDGCGWLVKIGEDKYYHPDQLADAFKQNNLSVKICYEASTEKFICGIGALNMPVIHVISIKK